MQRISTRIVLTSALLVLAAPPALASTPEPAPPPTPAAAPAAAPAAESAATITADPAPEQPANTLLAPAAKVPALRPVVITGSVRPPAATLEVVLERKQQGIWRPLTSAATDAAGAYSFSVTPQRPATWTVRTVVTRPDSGARVVSTSRKFTGVARLHPRTSGVRAADVPHSYRPGCPVEPDSLRRLELTHWGLDGKLHRGELILHRTAVDDMSRVFGAALAAKFPIQQMVRVDTYQGDDLTSMSAGNTSAFNCRKVVGNPYRLSRHSWGDAIDINPWQNPYVDINSKVYPNRHYLDRSLREPGMLYATGPIPRAMRREGWPWGARWRHRDYHHFSRTGA